MVASRKENNFKETLIGKIPRKWKVTRLGDNDLAEIIMGQSPPSSTYNTESQGVPFLQGKAEFGEIYPSPVMYCSQPMKIAKPNDILLSVRAPVGDVNIAPFECCIGRGLSAIRPNKQKLNPLFLFYYLKFRKKKIESIASGSTFKAIKRGDIEKLLLPRPPLHEQKKIVEILSTFDKAIEKVDQAIEKTERLKKGLMQELFTKGIVDSRQQTGKREFKDTKIGKIPKDWEVVRLREIISLEYGKGLPEKNRREGPYPVVGSNGIIGFHKKPLVDGPGIVIGRKGTMGAVSWIDSNFWPIDTTYYIKLKQENLYLKWLFFALSKLNLRKLSLSDVVPGLKRELVYALKLPLPPLPEQKKIAEILSTVDKRLELLRKRKEKLERIKRGLMNDLLTGRKRVKLGEQGE
jgi:type I restriction enzyme S subunit